VGTVSGQVLQNATTDISKMKTILNKTQKYLKHHCSHEGFEDTIKEATITAEGFDFEPISALKESTHPRKFCHECHYDPIHNPKERFKVECFYCILDAAVNFYQRDILTVAWSW
jgi:hypothetical protein